LTPGAGHANVRAGWGIETTLFREENVTFSAPLSLSRFRLGDA
jgi:hypothetical protein